MIRKKKLCEFLFIEKFAEIRREREKQLAPVNFLTAHFHKFNSIYFTTIISKYFVFFSW